MDNQTSQIVKQPWFWPLVIIIGGTCYALNSISTILFPFVMGLIGAYVLNGLVTRLERFRISRGLSSAIIIVGVIVFLVMLMMVFIPFVQRQLLLLATNIPLLVENGFEVLKPLLEKSAKEFGTPPPNEIQSQLINHLGEIMTWAIRLLTSLLSNGMVVANVLSLVFITPIVMFYLVKDWPILLESIKRIIPPRFLPQTTLYAQKIDQALSYYLKGQFVICLILMCLYSITLSLIGLPHGFFVGIATGIMSFIPYVGMASGLLASLAISLVHFHGINQVTAIFIAFISIGLIESYVLAPRFIGQKVGLHPVWIIFALLAAATLFGFLGVLLALPLAAIISVVVRLLIEWYRSTSLYAQDYMPKNKR